MQSSSRWSWGGSLCLVGAIALLCFKCAPLYWPFTTLALVGVSGIWLIGKRGLILAYAGWVVTFYFTYPESLGVSAFLVSIALSWFLIYWQEKLRLREWLTQEKALASTHLEVGTLKQQLAELYTKSRALDLQLKTSREQETELQKKLEEESKARIKAQGQLYTDLTLEDDRESDRQLLARFEEKSSQLHAARKDLFYLEGEVHLLRSASEEKALERVEGLEALLYERTCEMEAHIETQEELIGKLIPFANTTLVRAASRERER